MNDIDPDLENKKTLALTAPSEALAANVVVYKVLGINREFALFCMEELGRRRGSGEEFDFETYIETNTNRMPKPKTADLKGISNIMSIRNIASLIPKKVGV